MDERATDLPAISVRRMHEGEEGAVRALAGRAFSRLESAFFSPPAHTLVAERDGQLFGAVVPRLFKLPDKRRAGVIVWLMTDPETRSLGVGGQLVEAALPLSAGVALLFGWFFPTPGSVYPQAGTWRYRNLVPKLGPMAFAGASAVLAFAWAAWALVWLSEPPPEIYEWLRAAHRAGQMLALFEVLLPFSIFVSFNGRRVWDWSRPAWAGLAIVTAALFLVARL